MKNIFRFAFFITAVCCTAHAHDDVHNDDDMESKIIANCESERDSSVAQLVGAEKHVRACVESDLHRLGKLRKYKEQYPDAYQACHKTQPYGLSAAVICIESRTR